LSKASIRGGQYAKFPILRYERRYRTRECNNVIDIQAASLSGGRSGDCPALEIDRVCRHAKTISNPT
jgi:hypothetical protein